MVPFSNFDFYFAPVANGDGGVIIPEWQTCAGLFLGAFLAVISLAVETSCHRYYVYYYSV